MSEAKTQSKEEIPWKNNEDRIANYFVTIDPGHNLSTLPNIIRIKDCQPGETSMWEKRSFPKAARFHKKRQDTDPYRFFLSEMILYKGFTNETELGSR